MKYVGVRHKDSDSKLYWFFVPYDIANCVHKGSSVICMTRKGRQPGIVSAILEGFSDDFVVRTLGLRPSQRVCAVIQSVELERIHVPFDMAVSNPSPEKIKTRIEEFYSGGSFNTNVEVETDNTLIDGYTAYLVAKMFDHTYLKCHIESKAGNE